MVPKFSQVIKDWNDGYNNYKNHSIIELPNNLYLHKLILTENEPIHNNWLETMSEYLFGIEKIDVLYSGGIDSEFSLLTCKKLNKNVTAVTMKIIDKDKILNEYELNYSINFCKNNNIQQKIVVLDMKFYDNGDYIKFIEPYKISKANLASQFWLITQCNNFPIIGGNYFWIQENKHKKNCLSPMSYGSLFHDRFMKDNNITGIGNLLNYGYNGLYLLMKAHMIYYQSSMDLGTLKKNIYSSLIFKNFEFREPKNGFEGYEGKHLHLPILNVQTIVWDKITSKLLNTNETSNSIR